MTALTLHPQLQAFVDEQVRLRRYSSEKELIEAAIARLMLDPLDPDLDEATLQDIIQSRKEFEAGQYEDFKDVAARLRKKYGIR